MTTRLRDLLRCDLPIQLAPMGGVSATPALALAVRGSIEAAEALTDDMAGVIRLAGSELPVPRFSPQPPTRDSTGAIDAMPFYAGQSAGAVTAVSTAADIVAELTQGPA